MRPPFFPVGLPQETEFDSEGCYDQDGATRAWSASPASMGGDWSHNQPRVVALNHSRGLSVFIVGKDLHNLFRYGQDGPTGVWTDAQRMGGDWSQDHPVVIGGTPYVGMSVFLVAKDERGFGGALLGGLIGVVTSGLGLEILGVVGDLAGLAGLAGTSLATFLGKYLDDFFSGRPVLSGQSHQNRHCPNTAARRTFRDEGENAELCQVLLLP